MGSLLRKTDYFNLYAIGDGIYAAVAKPGQGAWSNAGIVDLGDSVLVFDSFGTPTAGKELRRQAEDITGKNVQYLVNSHYHGDHVFGNQAFKDVAIIATSETLRLCAEKHKMDDFNSEVKEMRQYLSNIKGKIASAKDDIIKQSLMNQYEEMAKVLDDLPELEIVLPSLIFEEKLIIRGSQRQVELLCFGGGHTPSDTFMYIPDEKIAFMGDLLTEKLHLPVVDPEQFQAILQRVNQMMIETFVPGHGRVCDLSLVETLQGYLVFLTEKAQEAHKREEEAEDFFVRLETPKDFADWKGVNGSRANLIKAYQFYEK